MKTDEEIMWEELEGTIQRWYDMAPTDPGHTRLGDVLAKMKEIKNRMLPKKVGLLLSNISGDNVIIAYSQKYPSNHPVLTDYFCDEISKALLTGNLTEILKWQKNK